MVVIVAMVFSDTVSFGANETPLAGKRLVGVGSMTSVAGVALGISWRQRHTLCIDIRVRLDGIGEGGGRDPTFMVPNTSYRAIATSLDVGWARAP